MSADPGSILSCKNIKKTSCKSKNVDHIDPGDTMTTMENCHNIDPTSCILNSPCFTPLRWVFTKTQHTPAVALQVGIAQTLEWYKDLFERLITPSPRNSQHTISGSMFSCLKHCVPANPKMGIT